ncbi:Uncharacterized protein dnm_010420 [Desulfonema magnum]|uniref:Uncharacterized protein n=1 Tax=Desulfonema magnum TaxID=45655 RepID=A0A975BGT6_9BACT|nr:Uncharacterized protein dnm_010420 [Desulfonema magnum]
MNSILHLRFIFENNLLRNDTLRQLSLEAHIFIFTIFEAGLKKQS